MSRYSRTLDERMRVEVPEGVSGDVKIERFTVSEDAARSFNLREVMQRTYRTINAGTYTKLLRRGALWMSDTPAEQADHANAVRQIERRGGRVLVNGLGLGMVIKAALSCENVTQVDVVEIDPDVIALVAPTYAGDERFVLHEADAHTIVWPRGTRFSVVWHDIWPTISADHLASMTKLKRRYGSRADWQGAWCESEMRELHY